MLPKISLFSLAAVSLYLLVMLAALTAAGSAMQRRQQPWHWQVWVAIALFFVVLAVIRALGLEHQWQDELRTTMRADGVYGERRDVQRPLAALLIAVTALIAFLFAYRGVGRVRGRRNVAVVAAAMSAFVMIGLVALRLVSLHPVDALLYGPIKLNWILDIGSSIVVLVAAVWYVTVVRQRI